MTDFALSVQELALGTDRVLVVGQLVGNQSGDGWFRPAAVAMAFEAMRIPVPANVSQALSQLRQRRLVMRRSSGGEWSLTPLGRARVTELMGEVDPIAVEAASAQAPGAELFHAVHMLIPPFFAPARWLAGIRQFLTEFDFDRNVFCMTRFPTLEDKHDPVRNAIGAARSVLASHGLTVHLASDRSIVDDLWGNVAAHGWACRYGIGLFEDRADEGLNYNLVAEIGAMLMTGRRCALLKDASAPTFPTDFAGQLYKEVDLADEDAVMRVLDAWITRDLGLA